MTIKNAFFAYSATPPALAETMENAIERINEATIEYLKLTGWKSSNVTGKLVLDEICRAIDDADIFLCDLTNLSMNVLFELGYAVAQEKRIWITLDSSHVEAKRNFKRMSPLSTVGCTYYENSFDLRDKFLSEQPYYDLENTLFKSQMQQLLEANISSSSHLLYLKCEVNTEASTQLTRLLKEQSIPLVTDDPEEMASQTLEWYTRYTYYAAGVIAHFIDEDRQKNNNLYQNAKYALIAGLAYGFGKPILMLSHSPFTPPIDFRNLLKVHDTAHSCLELSKDWLEDFSKDSQSQLSKYKQSKGKEQDTIKLRQINLGQFVAENERADLSDYFIVTSPYNEALRATQYLIYVGRKGTGKTANLFQLAEELAANKHNHICVIKPIDYELEGVLKLLHSNLSKTNPGYLAESLWKFLIYTELAASVYEEIQGREAHVVASDEEKKLCNYIDQYDYLIKTEFTERMEHAIRELCKIDLNPSVVQQRANVSEILHSQIIADLRELLGDVLQVKEKVVVLVDNLDKAWRKRSDLRVLSDFLFGLLGAGQKITAEFQKKGIVTWKPVNLVLIIFLRSDIYSHIVTNAREADKVVAKRIDWNDPILLHKIIEERFVASLDGKIVASEVWDIYFTPLVNGLSTKQYILDHTIPRPRDIIFFCQAALDHAINHRNSRIEELDIYHAEKNYSEHVFESLLSETKALLINIEELLYEFAGTSQIVTAEEIKGFMKKASVPIEEYDNVIELLCEHTFLGLETKSGNFVFQYEPVKKPIIQKLAENVATSSGKRRYKINIPFHRFLEITK